MHFALYTLVIVLLGFLFLKTSPLLLWPGAALLEKSVGEDGTRESPIWLECLNVLWDFYVLFALSAVVASLTTSFSSSAGVAHRWPYYILGFFGCFLPLQFMANEDVMRRRGNLLSLAGVALTPTAYIVFSLWHGLMKPWAWVPWVKVR